MPSFGGSLVISEASDAGFGLSRISLQDTSHRSHMRLHSKQIRDVVPASEDSLQVRPRISPALPTLLLKSEVLQFLTGSLDKHLKLTDLDSNSEMLSVSVGVPLWSCAWSPACSSLLFCGLSSGDISVYDTRHARDALVRFRNPDSNVLSSLIPSYETASAFYSNLNCVSASTAFIGGASWRWLHPAAFCIGGIRCSNHTR